MHIFGDKGAPDPEFNRGLHAEMLSQYFGGKLAEFSKATNKAGSNHSSEDEEEEAQPMDVSRSPQAAATVMGDQWAAHLQHILSFLHQLGLQVRHAVSC